MPRNDHWMTAIAKEVRQRAMDQVDFIAEGIRGSVAPTPPPKPPQVTLQDYLMAPPEMRQAMLQGLPEGEFSSTISRLQNEAVEKFGAMASTLTPMFMMDEARAGGALAAQGNSPELGVTAAHAELVEILGSDPFAP